MFSCLRHSEYPAQPRYLQRHLAGLAAYQSKDVLDRVVTANNIRVESLHLAVHKALQEVDHLLYKKKSFNAHSIILTHLSAVEWIIAGVQHYNSQLDVRQKERISIDLVQSEEESLERLDTVLVLDTPAGEAVFPLLVYGDQPPQHDVPGVGQVLGGGPQPYHHHTNTPPLEHAN